MEKILVVDDTLLMLNAIKNILSDEYEVFALQDGTNILETAKTIAPAIILLDIVMPKITGYEAITMLKNDPDTCEIPVIFITSLTDTADEERGLELGAVDYIAKPFRAGIIKARIKTQLQLLYSRQNLVQEREYAKVLAGVSDDVFWADYDIQLNTMIFTPAFSEFFHVPADFPLNPETNGKYSLLAQESIPLVEVLIENIRNGIENFSTEIKLHRYTGEDYWHRIQYKLLSNKNGIPIKAICRFTDITHQKRQIDELNVRAMLDPLTKLYNKEETMQRIKAYLDESDENEKSAMMIVDVDDFKRVNDSLGHQFGDAVLSDIAQKIKGLFRENDIVGRIGGDEFAVFMCAIKSEDNALKKAHELSDAFRHTYIGKENKYKTSGSIGIAFSPKNGSTFEELYRLADIALYESKHSGKDCCNIYHETMVTGTMVNTEPIAEAERFAASYFSGDLIYSIFEMLYETSDIETTLNMILGIIGENFDVDRCYIFEYSHDKKFLSNTYEWCATGISSEKENLQSIPAEQLDEFVGYYSSDGIFYCNELTTLDERSTIALGHQNILSILHTALYENSEFKGFIGFDDCHTKRVWRGEEIATLSYAARVLSTFIFKRQVSKELLESYEVNAQILDSLNGYVFVVNPKTYEMLYVNDAMSVIGGETGDICYRFSHDASIPCENCPLKKLNDETPSAIEEIYMSRTNEWLISAVSDFNWKDQGKMALVCCADISKYKK